MRSLPIPIKVFIAIMISKNYRYGDNMGLDLINKHVAKIFLALEPGDSIHHLSQKTGSSYSWTYKWVEKLEEADIIENKEGLQVKDREVEKGFENLARSVFSKDMDLEEAYLLPNFSGMQYRYSKIDAVFIWTKGGYQISRNKDDYPIFIDVLDKDLGEWKDFLDGFSVDYSVEDRKEGDEGVYFVLNPKMGFESEWMENASITPLYETVDWAEQYIYNFEPALEMMDEMYDLGLDIEYSERKAL